jgi:glycosyltransferase involved in cell wall biosynthesis
MPSITALLHTFNHALQLGRALETLHPCDEILIVDHHSQDATLRIAHEYGARIVQASSGSTPDQYWRCASFDWILCLEPDESLTEALAASLYEWKSAPTVGTGSISQDACVGTAAPGCPVERSSTAPFIEAGNLTHHQTVPFAQPSNVFLREEKAQGWVDLPMPVTRLIPRNWARWQGWLPAYDPSATVLDGPLLKFMAPEP